MASERKVPVTVSLTKRQIDALGKASKRLGISLSDMVRRVIDDSIDERKAA